jgi:hypothetical protein
MRRMYGGYFKGQRNASQLRTLLMQHDDLAGALETLVNWRPEHAEVRMPVARAVKPASLPRRSERVARVIAEPKPGEARLAPAGE